MMKLIKTVMAAATLALAAGSIVNAHAELGDTYAKSCQRFNGKGVVDPTVHAITWTVNDVISGYWSVSEWFVKNQCVAVIQVGSERSGMYESTIWKALQRNSLPTHVWIEYSRDENGVRNFRTTDDKLYGTSWNLPDGRPALRVAYKTWMEAHNLFTAAPPIPPPGGSDKAPIEDNTTTVPSDPTSGANKSSI